MKRPVNASPCTRPRGTPHRGGFTIVELVMATGLTLLLMLVVVTIFGAVGQSINKSKAVLEMTDRTRAAKQRLRLDLEELTVIMLPPRGPGEAKGYLEIIEGPVGPFASPDTVAENSDTGAVDTTAGDFDDVFMATIRSRGGPFVARYGTTTLESHEAEVAWFIRGCTLYRRVQLIAPHVMPDLDANNNGVVDLTDAGGKAFHAVYDISARPEVDASGNVNGWVPNTLSALTMRENRYAHRVHRTLDSFPFDARRWGQLGLPTLRECSHVDWMTWADVASMPSVTTVSKIDLWNDPHPWPEVDPITGTLRLPPPPNPPAAPRFMGPRVAEDVILPNVVSFDIEVWDPGAPVMLVASGHALKPSDPGYLQALRDYVQLASGPGQSANAYPRPVSYGEYVDLNYMCQIGPAYAGVAAAPNWVDNLKPVGVPSPMFAAAGHARSGLRGTEPYLPSQPQAQWPTPLPSVYDTWSFHYEHDGVNQDGDAVTDEGTNGFDDDDNGIVDDLAEMETSPPYPVPLKAIQIKIRVIEPDSRQVREVTIIHDFLPK